MKMVTWHYDNGKADAQLQPMSYEGKTEETKNYDRYVEVINDTERSILDDMHDWITDNLCIEDSLVFEDVKEKLLFGYLVDISAYC
jgi:hypothetical protein